MRDCCYLRSKEIFVSYYKLIALYFKCTHTVSLNSVGKGACKQACAHAPNFWTVWYKRIRHSYHCQHSSSASLFLWVLFGPMSCRGSFVGKVLFVERWLFSGAGFMRIRYDFLIKWTFQCFLIYCLQAKCLVHFQFCFKLFGLRPVSGSCDI